MNFDEIIVAARDSLDDTEQDKLWSDRELFLFADIAFNDAVVRTQGYLDSINYEISVKAGISEYPVDPLILSINRAKIRSIDKPLVKRTIQAMDAYRQGWETTTGNPTDYIDQLNENYIRLYPIPENDDLLIITTRTLPDTKISQGGDMDILPEHFHYGLAYLIAEMAYRKQDADTESISKADYFESLATRVFGQRKSANDQNFEREFVPKSVRKPYFC